MAKRRPQINFQVEPCMKLLYDEAYAAGHWPTRLCAAGLLLMIEEPATRKRAISRLREWEARYASASAAQIHAFVEDVGDAMQSAAPDSPPARQSRRRRKKGE